MKKLVSLLAIAVLSIFSISAQELENSTLWKISGNDLENPSYLFGTIHITCDATLSDDVKKALEDTTQMVMELDMDDPSMQSKMMAGIYMKDGKRIKDMVSEEDYNILNEFVIKNLGASLEMVGNMKPFMISASMYPKMIDCPMQSYELTLVKLSQAEGEEIYGLETVEEQLQVFEDIPYEDQIKDLLKSAKDNMTKDKENFAILLNTYKTQNINLMLDMMNSEEAGSIAQHQDKLLENRNKNWIPKIKEYSAEPTFFAVGAGHLAGENGVINLLRKEGYTVEAVLE
ncbi:TraB/GumN family protein [Winogradskyella sp. A3E31]|uniref:TraB/GumN family protein n=1 Tax=Winogradskyella sp. A3E31 TaxID=3349637 RepID=UPI00398AE38F